MPETTEVAANGPQRQSNLESTRGWERYLRPPVDIYETPDELVLVADMPGVSSENLEVHVDDGVLTLRGKAAHAAPGEPIFREFELANFFRQFELGIGIDAAKVQAELKNGVLKLHLPKSEEAKPRQIPVQM
jgi:HSP20 family protein